MAKRSGVFTLTELSLVQRRGNWPTEAFTKPPYSIDWQFGYYAGGPSHTGVTRLDFSTDDNQTSIRGPISFNSYLGCTTSSSSGGYVSGNESGGRVSSVCKIDYASDTSTASPKGPVNQIRGGGTGVGNLTYGWHCNGQPALTQVDRIDYSNDTATASPRGNLSFWTTGSGSSGNDNYGYIYHGSRQGSGGINSVSHTDRIDYSNDSVTSSPKGKLTATVYLRGATGNADYGYCAGGKAPGNNYGTAAMARMDYANDTATMSPKGPLSVGRAYMGSTGNSNFGYWGGGYNPGPGNMSHQDRLTFANDTVTCVAKGFMGASAPAGYVGRGLSTLANAKKPTSPLTVGDNGVGITTTGATLQYDAGKNVFSYPYGYFGGGFDPAIPGRSSRIDRIDFANDNASGTQRASLPQGIQYPTALGNRNFGYWAGGNTQPGPIHSSIYRYDYSNDTVNTTTISKLSRVGRSFGNTSNDDFGYFAAGDPGTGPRVSTTDRLDFSNDTATAIPRGPLTQARGIGASAGNKNFGWYAGGETYPTFYTLIDRIDYSNDTVTASRRGQISSVRTTSVTGNADYGWAAGGGSPGEISPVSTVDRIDYSNDTGTTSVRGPLSTVFGGDGATGNSSFGYYSLASYLQRINFSNDTATASPRGSLIRNNVGKSNTSSQINGLAQPIRQINDLKGPLAVANTAQQYAYNAGGQSPTYNTRIERLNYANDSNQTITKGNLQQGRNFFVGAGNQFYGYFGGGWTPGETSVVDRIDYSNDSNVAARVGPLSRKRYYNAAASNTDYGWFAGGVDVSTYTSVVDRIDFSNDAAAASPKGPLTQGRGNATATGNANYGWFGGGSAPGVSYSIVDRIDYSNDTPTASPKGNLTHGRYGFGSTGNANYGWFGGGVSPSGNISIVDRIDYSNDTPTASPKGPLSAGRYYCPATGNASYGYWFGGQPATYLSFIDRIDFSNDTATAVKRTYMTTGNAAGASLSASMNALPQG